MRILAVRGKNLASLEAFDIDFEADLGGAGLFAISGPTGAGKSTLLDAICLALFDKTPRMRGRSSYSIAAADGSREDGLGAHDVRGILRRGAGEAFAEVDFQGSDGARHRARWSVRRARAKATGRFQKQSMSLTELADGTALGGTRSETRQAIVEKLGLSFDQFCRSVLLAQGDFDAFLRADEKARATLLERMTGTEIYGEISVAAYDRAARMREELAGAESELEQMAPLSAEDRRALEAAEKEQRQALGRLDEQQKRFEKIDELAARQKRLRSELEELDRELAQWKSELADARERGRQAETDRGVLSVAKALLAERELAECKRAVEALFKQRKDALVWQRQHAELATLADQWPRWKDALAMLATRRRQGAELREQATAFSAKREDARTELGRAMTTGHEAARALAQAEEIEERAARVFDADRLRALDEELAQQNERLAGLKDLSSQLTRLGQCRKRMNEAKQAIEDLRAELQRLRADQQAQSAKLARCQGQIEQADRALQRTRAAMSLDERRGELAPGEPCPLCGSTEHPFFQQSFEQRAQGEAADLAALRQERDSVQAELASLKSDIATREARISDHQKKIAIEQADGEQALEAWKRSAPGLELAADPATEGVDAELEACVQQASSAKQQVEEQKGLVVERQRELDRARSAAKKARAASDAAREAVSEADKRHQQPLDALKANQNEQSSLATVTSELRGTLREPLSHLGDWWALLEQDEEAFFAQRAEDVKQWQERKGELELVSAELEKKRAEQEALARRAREIQEACCGSIQRDAIPPELAAQAQTRLAGELDAATAESRARRLAEAHDQNEAAEAQAADRVRQAEKEIAARGSARTLREQDLAEATAKRTALLEAVGATDEPALRQAAERSAEQHAKAKSAHQQSCVALQSDDDKIAYGRQQAAALESLRQKSEIWQKLSALVGSRDGNKLRTFAQNLTLEQMLVQANERLRELAPRYRLQPVPQENLQLQVVDCDMGNEVRSIASLSGGESFLVSLALALGLASLSARRVRVESMFIDEGFGSLDPDTLDVALCSLDSLQAGGRQIGIISHVAGLGERIGTQIRVEKHGGGHSGVRIVRP